jgi:hypothetical protein
MGRVGGRDERVPRARVMLVGSYRGEPDWTDMSEFVVHFTKATIRPADTDNTPYWQHLGIIWDGQITPSDKRWGAASEDDRLGDSQRAVCFSEVPLPFTARIADRRGSSYGLGFTQEFVRRQGAARVWYLDKDEAVASAFSELMQIHRADFDTEDPLWKVTPLVVQPHEKYRFEWEREWRLAGPHGLHFTMEDIAFLFIPEEWHKSARGFFDSYEPGTAPIPRCPFIDPHWDETEIESALTRAVGGPLASRTEDVLS